MGVAVQSLDALVHDYSLHAPVFERLPRAQVRVGENYRNSLSIRRLHELTDSISKHGIIKPILVVEEGDTYTVIAGRRRYMAAERLQLPDIPCMVYRDLDPKMVLTVQLSENMQRRIRSADIADSRWSLYKVLLRRETGATEEETEQQTYWDLSSGLRKRFSLSAFAERAGKDEKTITRAFLWQRVHGDIRRMVEEGKFSYSKAVELGRIPNRNTQRLFLQQAKKHDREELRRMVTEHLQHERRLAPQEFILTPVEASERASGTRGIAMQQASRLINGACEVLDLDVLCRAALEKEQVQELARRAHDQSAYFADELHTRTPYLRRLEEKGSRRSLIETILDGGMRIQGSGAQLRYEYRNVPLQLLFPDPQNPRKKYVDIESLSESIREVGVLEPVLAQQQADGTYRLIAGHRRRLGAIAAGLSEIPACVTHGLSEDEIRILQYEEAVFEEDSAYERAQALAELQATLGDGNGIARKLLERERRSGRLEEALRFVHLDPATRTLHGRGVIGFSTALLLGKVPPDDRLPWVATALAYGWSHKQLSKSITRDIETAQQYTHQPLLAQVISSAREQMYAKLARDISAHLRESMREMQGTAAAFVHPSSIERFYAFRKAVHLFNATY